MSKFLRWGTASGIAVGALLAALDLGFVFRDTGASWLSPRFVVTAFAVYLGIGVAAGVLLGMVWSRFGRPGGPRTVANMTFVLAFASLSALAGIHLFDLGLPASSQRNVGPYLVAVVLALAAAALVSLCLRGLLRAFARRGGAVAAATGFAGIVAGVLLVLLSTASRDVRPAETDGRPNLVLFVMDTTRLDSLSSQGNPAGTTPHLDRLAAEGVSFTRAYAAASWTPPSHASMFTGLYPSRHGTFSNQVALGSGIPTLAERLAEAGYDTFFISSKGLLLKSNGWARGFGRAVTVNVEDKVSLVYQRLWDRFVGEADPTRLTLDLVTSWLESRPSSRPFFLFVNVSVQHTPYEPREPVVHHFASHVDMSRVDQAKVRRVVKNQDGLTSVNEGRITLNPAEFEYIRCLYDGEGTYLDGEVGRFFETLRGLAERRKVFALVTSDHGELLGEHGLVSHGQYLYEELIHVPLILWGTGDRGEVDRLVTLTDVYPTLLALAGLKAEGVDGTSLLAPTTRRAIFAESFPKSGARKAVLADDLKYVWHAQGPGGLFDLSEDPGERRELSEQRPDLARAFVALLGSEFDLSEDGVAEEEIDDATHELLKSLGYVQ